ncbi:MAG: hypothetical protein ABIA66_03630 [Candidatus Omnitrophota bacterium]
MKKILLGLAIMFLITSVIYCQNESETPTTQTMAGKVKAMDWVGSILVVGDTRFIVSRDVKIYKGADTIDFTELNLSDDVKVSYYQDSSGELNAKTIVVGEVPMRFYPPLAPVPR